MTRTRDRIHIEAPSGRTAAAFVPFPPEAARALEADLKRALDCGVDFGAQGRALFATDASNYRQVPIGVVTPRMRDDVIEAVRICREHDAPIVARGGGTSLAGQTCNVAVAIDFSRHMHGIVDLDPEAKLARVEPGCILDRLRDKAEEHGLTFGPDPATHDHNTLGGMIGNNSCGVHSVMSGRTSDYVERLTVLTYDGALFEAGPTNDDALAHILARGDCQSDIYTRLKHLVDRYGDEIVARYPKIPRRVSGFENLDSLLPGHGFNVAKALTGTEGTCALVLDAQLRLVPSPACRVLVILGFRDVCEAAHAVPAVLEHHPLAVEGFDRLLHGFIERGNVEDEGLQCFPDGEAWLIVETGGETVGEARGRAEAIAKSIGRAYANVVTDLGAQKMVWHVRESALGATAFVPGEPDTWPGWEDSAVPPDRLGDYLADLRALFGRYGYTAALYGHFGDGLVHCRIDFDLRSERGIAHYRAFVTEAAALVTSYGGSLSGEHGDGESRAALLEIMYGPEMIECFRQFKAIWDPANHMNPGKAIEPFPIEANLRLGPEYRPPDLDTIFVFPEDKRSFARATIRCVGVGKCRRRDPGTGVMCPSYLATGEEKHSTRGRAHLLHEMVRGEVIDDGWRSSEVEDALSLCLACKGCRSDCPVGVDMASYKAEFRAHHYRGRLRPRIAYSMGLIHRWARLAERAPNLANGLLRAPLVGALGKRIGGIAPEAELPRFAPRSFRQWFRRRRPRAGGERVMLWPDTFNNHFRPETAIAATRLLEAAGYEVVIPDRPLCCGRPLYDWGFLDGAKKLWERTFAALDGEIGRGTPLIGLEPACTSAFKDELVNLFPDRPEAQRLSSMAIQFSDFVEASFGRFPEPRRGGRALVQAHCHHHAVIGFGAETKLFERLGIEAERLHQGCCGMAGSFGFAADTRDLALAIGERVLLPRVRGADKDMLIVADGFSCRDQVELNGGRTTVHIAELLAERMLGDCPRKDEKMGTAATDRREPVASLHAST